MLGMIFTRSPVCPPLSGVQYQRYGHNASILLPATNLHLAALPQAFYGYGTHENEMEPFTFDLRLPIIIVNQLDLLFTQTYLKLWIEVDNK